MAIFLTGSTGYIGAHVAANLLNTHGAALNLLVRAKDPQQAAERLWESLQLHMDFPHFAEHMQTRASVWLNRSDRTMPDSVIRCATLPRNGVSSPLMPRPAAETH